MTDATTRGTCKTRPCAAGVAQTEPVQIQRLELISE